MLGIFGDFGGRRSRRRKNRRRMQNQASFMRLQQQYAQAGYPGGGRFKRNMRDLQRSVSQGDSSAAQEIQRMQRKLQKIKQHGGRHGGRHGFRKSRHGRHGRGGRVGQPAGFQQYQQYQQWLAAKAAAKAGAVVSILTAPPKILIPTAVPTIGPPKAVAKAMPIAVTAKVAPTIAPSGLPAGWTASRHYCGGKRGQPLPAGFDEKKYLALNPDIAASAKRIAHGAATHYSCRGWREKRRFAGLGGSMSRPGYLNGILSNWDSISP